MKRDKSPSPRTERRPWPWFEGKAREVDANVGELLCARQDAVDA
jgi:hypothetical protein